MTNRIYIPSSLRAAGGNVRNAISCHLESLSKHEFLRVWNSIAFLFPGVSPDGYLEEDNGWPRFIRRVVKEVWRRAETGELTDNETYPYQAVKARITKERSGPLSPS